MTAERQTPAVRRVGQLLAERGIERWAPFLVQQEGKQLPSGVEAISGFVLTDQGDVFGFWLDWDEAQGVFVLDPWYRVDDVDQFSVDVEYQNARARLGLGG